MAHIISDMRAIPPSAEIEDIAEPNHDQCSSKLELRVQHCPAAAAMTAKRGVQASAGKSASSLPHP